MNMFKVRTYNQISIKGLERFPRKGYEVGSDIAQIGRASCRERV